jgi:predicted phage terminase large subunit-like protein
MADLKAQNSQTAEGLVKKGREDFLDYCHVIKTDFTADQFHISLCKILEKLYNGEYEKNKMMINAPPQHGKSLISSKLFPSWVMGQDPTMRILGNSYNQEQANESSSFCRRMVRNKSTYTEMFPETKIHPKHRNIEQWKTNKYGFFSANGIGSGISGKSADLGIIDDYHKGWEEAHSETQRDKVENWYKAEFLSRLQSESYQVIIATRWHKDDLSGRLLEQEGDEWIHITCRAIDEDGHALAPSRYTKEDLEEKKSTMSTRIWMAEYQQEPLEDKESGAKIEDLNMIPPSSVPEDLRWVRGWDLAYSDHRSADYTASCLMARDSDANFYLADLLRFKAGWVSSGKQRVIEKVKSQEVEHIFGAGGVQQPIIDDVFDALEGEFPSRLLTHVGEQSGKTARFSNWEPHVEDGNFHLVDDGSNWEQFKKEVNDFPNAPHDDTIDMVSNGWEEIGDTGYSGVPVAPVGIGRGSNDWRNKIS